MRGVECRSHLARRPIGARWHLEQHHRGAGAVVGVDERDADAVDDVAPVQLQRLHALRGDPVLGHDQPLGDGAAVDHARGEIRAQACGEGSERLSIQDLSHALLQGQTEGAVSMNRNTGPTCRVIGVLVRQEVVLAPRILEPAWPKVGKVNVPFVTQLHIVLYCVPSQQCSSPEAVHHELRAHNPLDVLDLAGHTAELQQELAREGRRLSLVAVPLAAVGAAVPIDVHHCRRPNPLLAHSASCR